MSDGLYNHIKSLASQLTPMEMMRLARWLEATADLRLRDSAEAPKKTHFGDLYGTWTDVHVTDEDIEEVRRDMLKNFPRDDI